MNIIYIDFKRKSLKQYNKQESLYTKRERLNSLHCELWQSLTDAQKDALNRRAGHDVLSRAINIHRVTRSFKARRLSSEIMDLVNDIRLEENTIEKVYNSNDVPF